MTRFASSLALAAAPVSAAGAAPPLCPTTDAPAIRTRAVAATGTWS